MAAQRADDRQFAGTLTPYAHCARCGYETRELLGGWCIDCAGPVDYPWWCETCQDFQHADAVQHRTCPDCGECVIWVGSETYEGEAA